MTKGILGGLAVLLLAWVALAFLVWEALSMTAGDHTAMRLVPYVNAHLLEEAAEGIYTPWHDPVFALRVFATSAPFGVAAFVAARGSRRAVVAVAAIGLLAFGTLNRHVLGAGFPGTLKTSFILEVLAAIAMTAMGAVSATKRFSAPA